MRTRKTMYKGISTKPPKSDIKPLVGAGKAIRMPKISFPSVKPRRGPRRTGI